MGKSGISGRPAASQPDERDRRSARTGDTDEASAGTGTGGLTRVTVNLNRQATQALERISEATGYSKTDAINRALQVYDLVQKIMERNDGVLNVKHDDGEVERFLII